MLKQAQIISDLLFFFVCFIIFIIQIEARDAVSYFVLEWEIKRNHPTECLNVQLINPKEIGQCLEDLL